MAKTNNSSIYISILALIISFTSLWLSHQNSQYSRMVAYEQKKQEIRQLLIESEMLAEKLEDNTSKHTKSDKNPSKREESDKIWNKVSVLNEEIKDVEQMFDTLPSSTSIEARLSLERVLTRIIKINKELLKIIELSSHGKKQENNNDS